MEPGKKIKIKKSFNKQNKQDALKILENTFKKLQNRYKQFGYNDSKEQDFFLENKGKEIVIHLKSGDINGTLSSIDKYRISIIKDDQEIFYYKHAIIGYFIK